MEEVRKFSNRKISKTNRPQVLEPEGRCCWSKWVVPAEAKLPEHFRPVPDEHVDHRLKSERNRIDRPTMARCVPSQTESGNGAEKAVSCC